MDCEELGGDDWEPGEQAATLLSRFGHEAERCGRPLWLVLGDGHSPEGPFRVRRRNGLFGIRVTSAARGVAVVGTGRAKPLHPSAELDAALRAGRGLRISCVVDRAGRIGWRMALPDGATVHTRPPQEGMMLDVLRRSLGLATPAPPRPIGFLHAAAWVASTVARASEAHGMRLTWQEVVALCPLVEGRAAAESASVVDVIKVLAGADAWERLRRLTAAGDGGCPWVAPDVAAWMDDGMFARWVLEELPPMEDLLAAAAPVLEPSAARRLAHVTRELGRHRPEP